MPDEIIIEDTRGREITHVGDAQVLPAYFNLLRGVPSPTQTVVLRNLSEKTARGRLVVSPVSGSSYASDVEVRTEGAAWGRYVEVETAPGSTFTAYARVLPLASPDNALGRAGVFFEGDFYAEDAGADTSVEGGGFASDGG